MARTYSTLFCLLLHPSLLSHQQEYTTVLKISQFVSYELNSHMNSLQPPVFKYVSQTWGQFNSEIGIDYLKKQGIEKF